MTIRKSVLAVCVLFFSCFLLFAQEDDSSVDESDSLGTTIASLEGHRFIELRGAIPVFPLFTSHGMAQSFVVGFADVFGDVFSSSGDYDHTTPQFATDLNITIFPPIAHHRLGFMAGAAIDTWNRSVKKNGSTTDETVSMNFYYVGFHGDYGHWVLSSIGTRISIYGELSVGWIHYMDSDGSDDAPFFDICPIGIQFCPEKHIGIYFEMPHLGARPFFQLGLSIGF